MTPLTVGDSLSRRVAVVTGSGSGIGRAVAYAYAREGARVIVADIDADAGAESVRRIRADFPGADALFVRTDVAAPEDQESLAETALERFGALHIACNCAGVPGDQGSIVDTSIASWRSTIEVNLSGVFYGMRAQIPRMLRSGNGVIVNVSSILGQVGSPTSAAYVAAKHGIVGLTRSAALAHARDGLRVVAVGPGVIDTPMIAHFSDEMRAVLRRQHPMGRLGLPAEVAELIAWLSSDRASFVTGAFYAVDGGFLSR